MLAEQGLRALPAQTVRDFIGSGIQKLVERCLLASGAEMSDAALRSFTAHYERVNGALSQPYPGVADTLERMRAAGLRLACVTNKAAAFTGPLLEKTAIARYFEAVVTSDHVNRRKPHPEPFLHACRLLSVPPAEALAIGDSANDAEGARAAGCRVLLVTYGYSEGRDVRSLDSDGVIESLADALPLLR